MLSIATMGLTIALSAPAIPAADKGGKIAWNMDPQKAMVTARKQGSGMMLYFTSDG